MGLTNQSTGLMAFLNDLQQEAYQKAEGLVALAGNPNTGKSTLFNALTGLRQHTGNWPGKTVTLAQGIVDCQGKKLMAVDLPGTYSLLANSVDEQVARDFLYLAKPAVTIVVVDATCLERNLNLLLQILELTPRVILCLNLVDEVTKKGLQVDKAKLAELLGIPVVATIARENQGVLELKETIRQALDGKIKFNYQCKSYSPEIEEAIQQLEEILKSQLPEDLNTRWLALRLLEGEESLLTANGGRSE